MLRSRLLDAQGRLADAAYKVTPVGRLWVARKSTLTAVASTVSATDLLNSEFTVPGNALGIDRVLRLEAFGDFKNNSGGSVAPPRLQLILGATTLIDTGTSSATVANSATRSGWEVRAKVAELNATNSQAIYFKLSLPLAMGIGAAGNSGFSTGEGDYAIMAATGQAIAAGFNTTSVDTTIANALTLKVINGSNSASYDTTLYYALAVIE
jgi:hypothetical protein